MDAVLTCVCYLTQRGWAVDTVSPETSKQLEEARQQDTQLIHMIVQHLSVGKNYNCLSDYSRPSLTQPKSGTRLLSRRICKFL